MKKTVLIVEDSPQLQKALKIALNSEGIKILQAFNGVQGLFSAFKDHPDLIILDLKMPQMDGMNMLKKLRNDKWGAGVSVMILTNLPDQAKLVDAAIKGVTDFYTKSDLEINEIIELVKNKLY